ncbi:MAG: S-methyl-5-thioribose-1-phosphate isomerase [candidate division WOR-3 bacterium]|nr:MAG: S-methyl-5-thioribose-1-phosphate isomerase [candidate division WOR-3 bacterium]
MRSTDASRPDNTREGSSLPSRAFRAVGFSTRGLRLLDQRALPGRISYLRPTTAGQVARAIEVLAVRGAPNIGVAAAYGMAVECRRLPDRRLRSGLRSAARTLRKARPTAVNLSWAVDRVERVLSDQGLAPRELRRAVLREARRIETEEVERSKAMARAGSRLLVKNATVLTICNTGALAAPGLGTALGVVFQAKLDRKRPRVYACETRPLLQGARLTMTELLRAGVDATLIVDSAAASVMPECDIVLVGADRVASNGDFANKVGTRMLAGLARELRKPLYVVAPLSSFDPECPDGSAIAIEERDGDEVRFFGRRRTAPRRARVFNPAFDVTPARFVTGFVTDNGIVRQPFSQSIRQVLAR